MRDRESFHRVHVESSDSIFADKYKAMMRDVKKEVWLA